MADRQMKVLWLLHGVNLDMLGKRPVEHYGTVTLPELCERVAGHAAPKGFEDVFPFHIQFLPLSRAPNKLKFIAGCELGAGSFLVDILPETAAQNLRNVEVHP